MEPVLLFPIIFFWTPPHFWALALFRSDDYAAPAADGARVAGPDADAAAIPALHMCWERLQSHPGRSAISTRSMASRRWCWAAHDVACDHVYRRREAPRRAGRRGGCLPSRSFTVRAVRTLLLEVVVRAVNVSVG